MTCLATKRAVRPHSSVMSLSQPVTAVPEITVTCRSLIRYKDESGTQGRAREHSRVARSLPTTHARISATDTARLPFCPARGRHAIPHTRMQSPRAHAHTCVAKSTDNLYVTTSRRVTESCAPVSSPRHGEEGITQQQKVWCCLFLWFCLLLLWQGTGAHAQAKHTADGSPDRVLKVDVCLVLKQRSLPFPRHPRQHNQGHEVSLLDATARAPLQSHLCMRPCC